MTVEEAERTARMADLVASVRSEAMGDARLVVADHAAGLSIDDSIAATFVNPASEHAWIEVSGDALTVMKQRARHRSQKRTTYVHTGFECGAL